MSLSRHKIFMSAAGAFLLLSAVVLMVSLTVFRKQSREFKQQGQRLESLRMRQPFPSAENVAVLETNLDQMEFRTGELAARLMQDSFPSGLVDAADFSARAQGVVERFRSRAERAGVHLAAGLEAGFARYASGGIVPAPEQVGRLMRQLYSVERVADVLVQSGVDSIREISRDAFEQGDDGQSAASRRPRRERKLAAEPRPPRPKHVPGAHPEGLYSTERINVVFTAKEAVVWEALRRFESAAHFMVVTEFAHTTQTSILSYNPEAVVRGSEAADDAARFVAEGILRGSKALARSERIVAGDEEVEVKLSVDVFIFDPAVSGEVRP